MFWFRAPIALLALFFRDRRPAARGVARGHQQKREPFDIAGAVLLALALSTLLLAINQAQRLGQGDYAAVPLAAAALAGIVLFLRQKPEIIQNHSA